MIQEYLYLTLLDSYLLMFMLLYTVAHVIYTRVLNAPRKVTDKVIDVSLNDKTPFRFSGLAIYVMMFNMFALPIAALWSTHYWSYIILSSVLMTTLFLSDIFYNDRVNSGNPGSIAYMVFPMVYIPAVIISVLIHWLGS